MTVRSAKETVALYNKQLRDIPGFLNRKQALIWGFLLELQAAEGISGNFAEIGVYEGRSALLLAAWQSPEESLTLVDPYESPELSTRLANIAPAAKTNFLAVSSEDDVVAKNLAAIPGGIRFFHIDGRHTAHSVRHELRTAAAVLAPRGLVCVDDFFSTRYPEVTQGVFDFVREHPEELQIVLCAFNKCFLCRPAALEFYLDAVGSLLMPVMRAHDFAEFTLFRSCSEDGLDCYSLGKRLDDHDTYGPDGVA